MAETRTPLLGLPQWSSGTSDSPSREDFNEAFANLEKWAPRFEQGPLNTRRAPGLKNTYYVDDEGTIWRDTGTAWTTVGMPRGGISIVKEIGDTNPGVRVEVPSGSNADAILTSHAGKSRFRVDSKGDVVMSSIRAYQSDTAAPAANLPTTFGIIPKSASASGIGVWGNTGQTGPLFEGRTGAGAPVLNVSPSGDGYFNARGSFGAMDPANSQLYVKGTQEGRPVVLARSSNVLLGTGAVFVAENSDGTFQFAKIDASGRTALGYRANPALLPTDLLALNTNITGPNNGGTPKVNGRATFRNNTNGYGVAGLDLRQEPGDGADTASLGVFAGTAGANGESPERVRFGITPEKLGARFTASAIDWTPVTVKAVAGQVAALLIAQRSDGTPLATIENDGTITGRAFEGTSTDDSTLVGALRTPGQVAGGSLRATQPGTGSPAGVVSSILANSVTKHPHFVAQDENGKARARINNDGSLEIGMDTVASPAGAVLLKMRGQEYRQFGRKLQSFDQDAGRWGSFESAFAAEYYSLTAQNVRNAWTSIVWNGEANDTEDAFGYTDGSGIVTVPFTGWYDIRALAHCDMNFTGSGSATFRINGVIESKFRRDYPRALGWDVVTLSLNDLVYLNRGDRMEFMIQIDSFFFTTKTKNTGDYRSRMSIRFAGNA